MVWGPPSKVKAPKSAWNSSANTQLNQVQDESQPEKKLENTYLPIKVVKIEALAVLKIIKSSDETNSGTLLGECTEQVSTITDSFSHPKNLIKSSDYQRRMMSVLNNCFVDKDIVGTFLITDFSPFATQEILEQQIIFQSQRDVLNEARSVLLVLDKSKISKLDFSSAIRIYRVNQSIVAARKQNMSLGRIKNIFEEIPVEINYDGPRMMQFYLNNARQSCNCDEKLFDSLNLATKSELEGCCSRMIEEASRLENEDSKMSFYERQLARQKQSQHEWLVKRRAENKVRASRDEPLLPETDPYNPIFRTIEKPSKTEGPLARIQLSVYSEALNKYVGKTLPKIYMTQN